MKTIFEWKIGFKTEEPVKLEAFISGLDEEQSKGLEETFADLEDIAEILQPDTEIILYKRRVIWPFKGRWKDVKKVVSTTSEKEP